MCFWDIMPAVNIVLCSQSGAVQYPPPPDELSSFQNYARYLKVHTNERYT